MTSKPGPKLMFPDSGLVPINVVFLSVFFFILLILLFQPYIEGNPSFAFEDYALIFRSVNPYVVWGDTGEKATNYLMGRNQRASVLLEA